ncbi:OLC1v1016838C1 [Oldenlandia corymbosa var. corymbosa]|nr:OLC1v1016838C1 [Oldenlandia corymbosa var. corymbosa]
MLSRSSNNHVPTYSHIHIHDISRGVQKLNQILRTCSNGVNFDRYSVEVGQELLRGAMDLEESLRMLINMQEASDYMLNSQRKNKIKLLEENEDDQTETAKEDDLKIVARPRFSFDKPKNQQSNKEAPCYKQHLMALTYLEGSPKLPEKQPHQNKSKPNSFSHSRSASCVPDFKSLCSDSEPKEHTKSPSKPEKGRISNVIAKLMGLDELSPKEGSNAPVRELSSNKKEVIASKTSPINEASQHQDERNGRAVSNNKQATTTFRTSMLDSKPMPEAESIPPHSKGSSRVIISEIHWQNLEVATRKYAGPGSKTITVTADKQELNGVKERDRLPGYKEMLQEKEKNSNNKAENKELLAKVVHQQNEPERPVSSKAEDGSDKNMELKRSAIQASKKNAHSQERSRQQIKEEVHELRQRGLLKKSDQLEQKRKERLPKPKKQVNESKGNQVKAMVASKVNRTTKSSQTKKPYGTLAPAEVNKKKAMEHKEVKFSKTLSSRKLHEDSGVQEFSINQPSQRKNGICTKAFEDQNCQVNVASNTGSLTPDVLPASPDQNDDQQNDKTLSSCDGDEQESSNHPEDTEVYTPRFDKPEESTDTANVEDLLPSVAEQVNFSISGEDSCRIVDTPETQLRNQKTAETFTDTHEVPEDHILVHRATEPSDKVLQDRYKGANEESRGVSKVMQNELKKIQAKKAAKPLTESEKNLKEKLIKGQQFLNTAEAFFKLNIPVSILDDSNDQCGQDAETKLILDCGYELLKKKGQRLEVSVYPRKQMSVTVANKVNSLDDLIRQLSQDFNTLKSYGGNSSPELETADCLSKMLEKDFEKSHSEVSSMWDCNWISDPFGFQEYDEIVKELEKHLLNGLLNEITQELLLLGLVLA